MPKSATLTPLASFAVFHYHVSSSGLAIADEDIPLRALQSEQGWQKPSATKNADALRSAGPCRSQSLKDQLSSGKVVIQYAYAILDAPEASHKGPTASVKLGQKKVWWDYAQLAQPRSHSLSTLTIVDDDDDSHYKSPETSAAPSMISDDESDDEPDDGLRTPPPVARAMPRVRASTLLSGSGLQLSVSPRSEPMSDSNEEALLEPLPLPDLSIPFEDSRAMNVGRMGGSRAWLSRKMIFGTGGPSWRSSQNVASTSAS